jgi:hypothetical protein
MARRPTVHRGAVRFGTPASADLSPSQKGALTRARVLSIVNRDPERSQYMRAAWQAVKGRKPAVREAWLRMQESTAKEQARAWQGFLMDEYGRGYYEEEGEWPEFLWYDAVA